MNNVTLIRFRRELKLAYERACPVSLTLASRSFAKLSLISLSRRFLFTCGTAAVIWIPDASLKALDPDEMHGTSRCYERLEDFRPEEWGLPAM